MTHTPGLSARLRQATPEDIPAMHHVRMSVRENRLISGQITPEEYLEEIESTGRGWVVEVEEEIVGFAVGNRVNGNIWALFVHPDHEGRGYGRALHEAMIVWLRDHGPEQLWLTTDPNTRAHRLYERAGWRLVGSTPSGELRFELP